MKKSTKIIIIVAVIVAVIIAAIGVFAIIKIVGPKDPISAEEFKEKMEDKNFVITDANDQFIGQGDIFNQIYVAYTYDDDYQIEFYDFKNDENAEKFFNKNKSIFEAEKDSTIIETNTSGSNSAKYTLTCNGEFMVVSRIANTVIFLRVDDENKSEIQDILKELGY